jgi:hypothetical protein
MYLILLLTYKKNLQKVFGNKNVWLEKTGLPYLILCGDETINEDYSYDNEKKILMVKCPDTYEYITLKLACAYKFIITSKEMMHIKGMFKVDDDVFVNVSKLNEFIKENEKIQDKNDYIGRVYKIGSVLCNHHHKKVKNINLNDIVFRLKECYICFGPMYYLSRRALCEIINKFSFQNFNIYSTQLFEDYTFGNILLKTGILPIKSKMFTDDVREFINSGFVAFHDANHVYDVSRLPHLSRTETVDTVVDTVETVIIETAEDMITIDTIKQIEYDNMFNKNIFSLTI